jgi:hypothetical protein
MILFIELAAIIMAGALFGLVLSYGKEYGR